MRTPGIAWPLSLSLFKLLPEDCAVFCCCCFKHLKFISPVSYRFLLQGLCFPLSDFWLRFQSFWSPKVLFDTNYTKIDISSVVHEMRKMFSEGLRTSLLLKWPVIRIEVLSLCVLILWEVYFVFPSHLPLSSFTFHTTFAVWSLWV